MAEYDYKCERSQHPMHQSNGLRAQYNIAGSITAKNMQDAYDQLLPNLSLFMRAIPGVFKLAVMGKRNVKIWDFDTRPIEPVKPTRTKK